MLFDGALAHSRSWAQSVAQPGTQAPVAPTLPVPAPAAKAPGSSAQSGPKPDVWSQSEIDDARRICHDALQSIGARYITLPPIKDAECGAPAPIRVSMIGDKLPVKLQPPATISCTMLEPLKRWLDTGLQPLAQRHLDGRVTAITLMSSYVCRTRYGRPGTKMSEHAFANALDIGGFKLADGRRISVLKDWGPTRRDLEKTLAEQRKLAESKAKLSAAQGPVAAPIANDRNVVIIRPGARTDRGAGIPPPPAANPARDQRHAGIAPTNPVPGGNSPAATPLPSRPAATVASVAPVDPQKESATLDLTPPLPTRRPLRRAVALPGAITNDRNSAGQMQPERRSERDAGRHTGSKRGDTGRRMRPPYRLGGPTAKGQTPRSLFLRDVHESACGIFGTTLGPEANEAHRNHFHIDMHPRRSGGYCE
jgi:hypothetical protein